MWNMVGDMMPDMGRFGARRKQRGMNTATAMLLGAGIGIATWEVMRRTNTTGAMMNGMNMNGINDTRNQDQHEELNQRENGADDSGMNNNTVTEMADDIMKAIQ